MTLHALRTPDACFAALPGYPWQPHDVAHERMRVCYLDEGPRDAAVTALCLHGNPTWSYLYRHMIPVLTAAGLRVVAPDLIGFGRSDKPADEAAHSFEMHRGMLQAFVARLDLRNVMLVVQDWGGILGLTLPMDDPARYTRLLVMNTTLATGQVSDGFRQWRAYAASQPDLGVGKLIRRGKPDLTPAEAAAYDAPFPDAGFKAALRAFPRIVPDGADAPGAALSRRAAAWWRDDWQGSSFMAVGMQDPVLGPAVMASLRQQIRGCPAPLQVPDGGHFLPEWGGPVAHAALRHFALA